MEKVVSMVVGLLLGLLLAAGGRADEGGLTADERQEYLDKHNELRGMVAPTASNMKMMKWNYDLEKTARLWAEGCVYAHGDPNCTRLPFSSTGQNLFAATALPTPTKAVQAWYDEVKDYTYDTMECTEGEQCGHYTQVVWAESTQVGCAMKQCEPLQGPDWPKGFLVVCNYGPAGNYKGEHPFKSGEPCSECGEFTCDDKLCENQSWNYTISSSPPESKMVCNGSPNDSGDKGGDKNGKKENGDGTNGDHDSGSSVVLPGISLIVLTFFQAYFL